MIGSAFVEMRNISKAFFGVKVFDNFSLELKAKEIHCICGENGAGKSTLIKILSGAYQPDAGEIFIDGKLSKINDPRDALKLGIQTVYQENTLFEKLQVYENLFVGREYDRRGIIDKKAMVKKTQELLSFLNADSISPFDIVLSLSIGQQKLVELARGLIMNAKIIIMDEPTSSFSRKEITHLLEIIRKLKESGMTIIYISHHLEEVFEIADRVTVIRDGKLISTYDIKGLAYKTLINDMVGRDVSTFYQRDKIDKGDICLQVKNLWGNGIADISFELYRGEVLGIAGMVGAGKTELAELLFGKKCKDSGEVFLHGKQINIRTPKDAIANKMCLITENRQFTGLFLDHTIQRNIVLPSYQKTKTPFISPKADDETSKKYVNKMNVVTTSIRKKVKELSGGNQQKVVLAKWFVMDGEIYLFDEPTRGIDIGAREEIYKLMTELLKAGKAILMISSDMPELIAISDRICVMRDGRIVANLDHAEFNERTILHHSIGGSL